MKKTISGKVYTAHNPSFMTVGVDIDRTRFTPYDLPGFGTEVTITWDAKPREHQCPEARQLNRKLIESLYTRRWYAVMANKGNVVDENISFCPYCGKELIR